MNVYSKTYKSLSIKEKEHFFEYLKSIKEKGTSAYINMWDDVWGSKNETLPLFIGIKQQSCL